MNKEEFSKMLSDKQFIDKAQQQAHSIYALWFSMYPTYQRKKMLLLFVAADAMYTFDMEAEKLAACFGVTAPYIETEQHGLHKCFAIPVQFAAEALLALTVMHIDFALAAEVSNQALLNDLRALVQQMELEVHRTLFNIDAADGSARKVCLN